MGNHDMSNGIVILKSGGVARIVFAHAKQNSFPASQLKQLQNAFDEVARDATTHVIVLQSDPTKAFCAGASFDELLEITTPKKGKDFFMGFANVINAIRCIPQLVIGRVQGKTVGGGVGLASATDYCLATKFASVKLSELAVGIGPFVVGPAVERKLGVSGMSELAVDATEWRSADWAAQRGLYAGVYDSAADLDAAVDALAGRLAASNPEAMTELKRTFWAGTEEWDTLLSERAAISGRLVLSAFTRNAIAKFKAK